jgi:hypothetical protein
MRTTQQILADLRQSIGTLSGTRIITSWAKQDIINKHVALIDELEAILNEVKTTIDKAAKPTPVEPVAEVAEVVEKTVATPKAKATTAKK